MKNSGNYELTILVPVFNEEENMERLEQRLSEYMKKAKTRVCILFINDCSTDRSLHNIKEICRRNDGFSYISLSERGGLSTALKAGIDNSETKYTGYIDADLQTSPMDFDVLLEYVSDYELVTGIRANRKDSSLKKIQSKIANSFRRMMTGDKAKDTGCPLKIIHTETAKRIPFFKGMHRFLPALVMLQNGKIKEVEVNHFPRMAGKSKYNLRNRLISPFIDCFAYRWMKKRYINYKIDNEITD